MAWITFPRRHLRLDGIEEADELLVPMALHVAADDGAVEDRFDLSGRVVVITGGAGLLGQRHAGAVADAGATPVLVDIDAKRLAAAAAALSSRSGGSAATETVDITDLSAVEDLLRRVLDRFGRLDVLINNAANNPAVQASPGTDFSRLESMPLSSGERISMSA